MSKLNLALFGGEAVRVKTFPNRVSMSIEEKTAALRVLDSDVLSGFIGAPGRFFNGGKEVQSFEKVWADKYQFKHAISTNSWTTGLQACFGAVGLSPGDEVICPPFTMSASATAALFYGGIPIFADVDPVRFTIDPKEIEKKITSRTRVIVVVHLFGYSADMDKIVAIAKKYKLKIIEDAAQAPGVFYKGRPVGAIGDIGGFSLNFHKHIHSGEGGLIVTNNSDLSLRTQLIRNHGENVVSEYGVEDLTNLIGSNFRLTELQAAIASEQFKKLEAILEHRMHLAKKLDKRIASLPGLTIQTLEKDCTHAYYMYPIKYDKSILKVSRATFTRAVTAELPAAKYWDTTPLAEGYVKPLYLTELYQKKIAIGRDGFPFNQNPGVNYSYKLGDCPVVERLYQEELLISPLIREGLNESDINDFANAIEKVVENIDELIDYDQKNKINMVYDPIKAIDKNVN